MPRLFIQADVETQTEFGNHDEKLIKNYRKVIKDLQKQLELANNQLVTNDKLNNPTKTPIAPQCKVSIKHANAG